MKIAIKAKVKVKAKPEELKDGTLHVDPGKIKVKVSKGGSKNESPKKKKKTK